MRGGQAARARLIRFVDKAVVAPAAVLVALARRGGGPSEEAAPGAGRRWVAIKLVGMGDAVLMLPALGALHTQPGDHLTVITTRRCQQIFEARGVADRVVVLGRGGVWRRVRAAWAALRACDAVLDFEQHVYWSTALTAVARGSARRLGFRSRSRMRRLAYDELVDPGAEPRPMKEIFDDLARAGGRAPVAGLLPLPVGPEAASAVDGWIEARGWLPGSYLVVAPGSGATVSFRRLPAATWAEILRGVPAEWPVVLAGTKVDAGLLQEIGRLAGRPCEIRLDLSLAALAHLFSRARAAVATDSGPMHLAAAMGAPVVGVFGPDTPRRYAPYSPRSRSASLLLPCSPCNNCWVYREAHCTNPDRYACTQKMAAGVVLEQLRAAGSAEAAQARAE